MISLFAVIREDFGTVEHECELQGFWQLPVASKMHLEPLQPFASEEEATDHNSYHASCSTHICYQGGPASRMSSQRNASSVSVPASWVPVCSQGQLSLKMWSLWLQAWKKHFVMIHTFQSRWSVLLSCKLCLNTISSAWRHDCESSSFFTPYLPFKTLVPPAPFVEAMHADTCRCELLRIAFFTGKRYGAQERGSTASATPAAAAVDSRASGEPACKPLLSSPPELSLSLPTSSPALAITADERASQADEASDMLELLAVAPSVSAAVEPFHAAVKGAVQSTSIVPVLQPKPTDRPPPCTTVMASPASFTRKLSSHMMSLVLASATFPAACSSLQQLALNEPETCQQRASKGWQPFHPAPEAQLLHEPCSRLLQFLGWRTRLQLLAPAATCSLGLATSSSPCCAHRPYHPKTCHQAASGPGQAGIASHVCFSPS